LYGRGIIDSNARYLNRRFGGNKRLIPLFINGTQWRCAAHATGRESAEFYANCPDCTDEIDRPWLSTDTWAQRPRPIILSNRDNVYSGFPGSSSAINQANPQIVYDTGRINVSDLLLFDSWFYHSSIDSAHDINFTNFKVNTNSYYHGGIGWETDGFKINASNGIVFDNGWLTAGDDPFTIAACGPYAFGNAFNNVVKNSVFCVYNAGYVRFAFVEHGFTFHDNLISNIYCIETPNAFEVLKLESYGGYQYDEVIRDNTFADWYIDDPVRLLEFSLHYINGFRYKGMYDIFFDRFVLSGVTNNSRMRSQYPDTRSELTFTDLMAAGEFIETAEGAGITIENPPTGGTLKADFVVTGNTWVDVNPKERSGLTITEAADYAQFTFTGTEVNWITSKGPGKGTASVYIDNRLVDFVNLEAASVGVPEVVFNSEELPPSRYTIRVEYNRELEGDSFSFKKYWGEICLGNHPGRRHDLCRQLVRL
jgi:hypothetical protein